jgi:hypothetical protein
VGPATGSAPEVSARLSETLKLWRGPALADVDSILLGPGSARLEEFRWLAFECGIEAHLTRPGSWIPLGEPGVRS